MSEHVGVTVARERGGRLVARCAAAGRRGHRLRQQLEHVVCVRALSHHQEKVEASRGCRRARGHVVREDIPDRLDRAAPAVAPREERQEECRPPQAEASRGAGVIRCATAQGRALIVDVVDHRLVGLVPAPSGTGGSRTQSRLLEVGLHSNQVRAGATGCERDTRRTRPQ